MNGPKIALILVFIAFAITLSGCADFINQIDNSTLKENASTFCNLDNKVFCGYCLNGTAAAVDDEGRTCSTCPFGYTCPTDYCGDAKCIAGPEITPNCPAQTGETYCGFCQQSNQCTYCPQGSICPGDVCNGQCTTNTGGGGGGQTNQNIYAVGCSDCPTNPSIYSYNRLTYEQCWYYWQQCNAMGCGKVTKNCK